MRLLDHRLAPQGVLRRIYLTSPDLPMAPAEHLVGLEHDEQSDHEEEQQQASVVEPRGALQTIQRLIGVLHRHRLVAAQTVRDHPP